MLNTITTLLNEKDLLNGALPVNLRGQEYFIEVEYLIENATELSDDRIELHARRIMKADFNNDMNGLINALQAMAREVLRTKPELLTNAS